MRGNLAKGLLALLIVGLLASITAADVKLPGIFGDHMVLQCAVPVPVWGWADPGEKVTVSLAGQSQTATADSAGKWSVRLGSLSAGGPYVLRVQGKNTLERSDVLAGEVWLCSGQSNMAMTVSAAKDADAEIAAAKHPQMRLCTVARKTAPEPQNDCEVSWGVCSPETVGKFSAAAYFFGRELHNVLEVPVGLIDSSWGGTPVQAWTSLNAQEAVRELLPMIEKFKAELASYNPATAAQQYEKQVAAWKSAVAKAKAAGKQPPRKPQLQDPATSQNSPGRLYNGMIAPLAPYALRGAIWYQGESNANLGNAHLYGRQLRTMITNWRQIWGQAGFPFLYVQLPNFRAPQREPSETDGWPIVREQMLKTLALSDTGMAVTIDIGEADNIHPKNKQEVGRRLAQWALAKTYNKEVIASGPLYKAMTRHGDKLVIYFDYVDGGLVAKGGEKVKGFAIAGDDKKFVWADATIEGGNVLVSSPEVENPVAVRYAWANNPDCNLANKAGLPASPFRSDDWEQ